MNLKAGLLLIPMGIINEYHEPAIYNGVERPNVDKKYCTYHLERNWNWY